MLQQQSDTRLTGARQTVSAMNGWWPHTVADTRRAHRAAVKKHGRIDSRVSVDPVRRQHTAGGYLLSADVWCHCGIARHFGMVRFSFYNFFLACGNAFLHFGFPISGANSKCTLTKM